jgi:hypothetical protein
VADLHIGEIEGWGGVEYEMKILPNEHRGRVDILLKAEKDDHSYSAEVTGVDADDDEKVQRMVLMIARRIAIQLRLPQPLGCRVSVEMDNEDEVMGTVVPATTRSRQ